MIPTDAVTPAHTLADLATTRAGASRVFQRHGLDFCCGGRVSLAEACAERKLDVAALIEEIESEVREATGFDRWDERPLPDVIDHVLGHFHEPHRRELPRLREMAEKVERVHADKASCPRGLALYLAQLTEELEQHMQKEEQILFPLLRSDRAFMAAGPIQVMEEEHRDVAEHLARLRELTGDYTPPPEACGTWTALYLGLAELQHDLMEHVHLENNVLFPRALRN